MSTTTGTVLSSVITSDMCMGALAEVTGLLPIALPPAITYIGIRKGISFVLGLLRAA